MSHIEGTLDAEAKPDCDNFLVTMHWPTKFRVHESWGCHALLIFQRPNIEMLARTPDAERRAEIASQLAGEAKLVGRIIDCYESDRPYASNWAFVFRY